MRRPDEHEGLRIYRSKHLSRWRLTFRPGEVHSLFDELIHKRWGRTSWHPNTDVVRTATGYVVEVDLPGVEAEAVEVAVHGRFLTIEGRRVTARSSGEAAALICERPEGRFSRVIQFGEVIDGFKVDKGLVRGVLTLVLTRA
jgi:HSP20 family protein